LVHGFAISATQFTLQEPDVPESDVSSQWRISLQYCSALENAPWTIFPKAPHKCVDAIVETDFFVTQFYPSLPLSPPLYLPYYAPHHIIMAI